MSRFVAMLSAGVLAFCSLPAHAACTLFQHVNFSGASFVIGAGHSRTYFGDAWNDQVSSVRVTNGCRLIAFEHRDFKGDQRVFASSTSTVGNLWNDKMSSAWCSCGGQVDRQCILYEHRDFQGHRFSLAENTNASFLGTSWNDKVSSIRVPQGCTLTAYQHRDFGGDRRVFNAGSTAFVGNLWNDQISSARCQCR